jgi:hypothetical protein
LVAEDGTSGWCINGFYNCILANVTNLTAGSTGMSGNHNGFYNSPGFGSSQIPSYSSPFQTAGAGSYYLTNGSAFRNQGSASYVWTDLQQKTTWPPLVYSNVTMTTNLTLSPQATRDTNASPDLGYHYDPLDYVFGGCILTTNLTFTPGTAIGWYMDHATGSSSWQPYAISLNDGANLTFAGTAGQPCHMAKVSTVQEGSNGNWTGWGWMGGVMLNGSGSGGANAPQLNSQFTKWSVPAAGSNHFRDNVAYGVGNFYGSEFYGNGLNSYWPSLYFTNCLFYRCYVACWDTQDTPNFTFLNCTFYKSFLALLHSSGQPSYASSVWTIKNTAFDGTAFFMGDNYVGDTNHMVFNYNAYDSSNTNWMTYYSSQFPFTNIPEATWAHDLTHVVNFNWQSSWLGDFYLPTGSTLINAGSTNANLLGFYQFTTQTSQLKETNSIVDIGYHYVATDVYGNPIDSNGNGIPDYLEDADGNGLPDWWEIANFGHTGVNLNADPDGDGWSNLQEYLNGTNPTMADQPFILIITEPAASSTIP